MSANLATTFLTLRPFLVVLWLHSDVDPTDLEWNTALGELAVRRRARHLSVDQLRQVVISDGGSPNAGQRKHSAAALDGLPSKLAVLTTVLLNPIKRGAATAVSWLNPAVRFYYPTSLTEALEYLEVGDHRATIGHAFQELQSQLPHVRALELAKF